MIRWITERLGTAAASSTALEPDMRMVDVRDLVDKSGNSSGVVRHMIDGGVELLAAGHRVVVCCDYGISRSNAIAAGILAMSSGMPLPEAVRAVYAATEHAEMKLEPLQAVRGALGEGAGRNRLARSRVLITGASGLLGRALTGALGPMEVIGPPRPDVDLLEGAMTLDLLVKDKAIDRVVHLANPRVYTSNRAAGDMVTMLRNVIDVCRTNDVGLVFLSSWEVYSGYGAASLSASEHLPLLPKGPYGEGKLLCEGLIELHQERYGLDATVIRSSPVYGGASDRPKFLFNFIDKARRGAPIWTHRYRNGLAALDLLHVDDLVRALAAVVETDHRGTLNVGTGRLVSTRDVAQQVVAALGSTSTVDVHDIDDEVANVRMDASAAARALAWSPLVPFEQGLRQLIETELEGRP
jgi:UDP-glucuronate decarboxylase